jgi:EmrB/QacA subfamily drug resistance transporter
MTIRNAPYKYLVATAFICGLFMDLLDLTVLNVALPTLGRQFHAGTSTLEWVVTGYLLSLAIWIPASGWIGDRVGTKKTFMFALAMFVTGSALCGVSQSIGQLIACRILQGVGGGMLTPVGTAMLFRAFPPEERAKASMILTIPTAIGPAIGPVLGGWLVDYVSWRWIFYVNLPIGIAAFVFSLFFLKESKEASAGRFDLAGFALAAIGLASLLYGLSAAPTSGWTSAKALASFAIAIVAFAALVPAELRNREPMLDLRLFANRMFRSANLTLMASFASLVGMLFIVPLFLQNLQGYSAIKTGLVTMATAITVILAAPLVGRLYPRVGPRRLLMFALAVFAATSAAFTLVSAQTSIWLIIAILSLQGVGIGFTFIPAQAATFSTIAPVSMGRASSLYNTNRQVAGSLGVAILATVLTQRTLTHVTHSVNAVAAGGNQAAIQAARQHGALLGFHDAYFVAALIGLLGVLAASRIRDPDAAASMAGAATGELVEAPAA